MSEKISLDSSDISRIIRNSKIRVFPIRELYGAIFSVSGGANMIPYRFSGI